MIGPALAEALNLRDRAALRLLAQWQILAGLRRAGEAGILVCLRRQVPPRGLLAPLHHPSAALAVLAICALRRRRRHRSRARRSHYARRLNLELQP